MPITPFHFGPGAAIHAIAPNHVSFLAIAAANLLVDVEPLYFMLARQYPLHRFFHTYLGASLVAAGTIVLFLAARQLAARFRLPNLFKWRDLGVRPVALGAFTGSYSHIALDSLMHQDIAPLAPFSNANPLLQTVALGTLHWACLASGLAAVVVLAARRLLQAENAG